MTLISERDLGAWLEAFSAAVRARDLDAGRALFADDAVGFGTVAGHYADLDDLASAQWSDVWPRTEEFAFDEIEHQWLDDPWGTVAVTWRSVGTETDDRRIRTGRATIVLRRTEAGVVAVHSHFSMTPGTPA